MGYQRKAFSEKLADDRDLPRVERLTGGMRARYGPGTILIPAPSEVLNLMGRVPEGKVLTINQLRNTLARRHGATMACPIVTGILARIVAGAAGEQAAAGALRFTPYWRTLKGNGELNPKYPGGISDQRRRLEREGHRVRVKKSRAFVEDVAASMWNPR